MKNYGQHNNIFNVVCLGRKDYIRYIKHQKNIVLTNFYNEKMRYLLECIAAYKKITIKEVKKRIIKNAEENYNNVNISIRQINKMIHPKKDICSKNAPVIAMVIFEMVVSDMPEILDDIKKNIIKICDMKSLFLMKL